MQAILHGLPNDRTVLTPHQLGADELPEQIVIAAKWGTASVLVDVTLLYRFAYHDGEVPHYQLATVDGLDVAPLPELDEVSRKPLPPAAWQSLFQRKTP